MQYLTKDFTSSQSGVPMMARLVPPGEGYGLWDKETDNFVKENTSDEMLVEFYDTRYDHEGPFPAQFISRYYLGTLKEGGEDRGLCLDGGCS